MLNVNQFYSRYGANPNDGEHIEFCGKQVIAYSTKVFIICLEQHQDPFNWLSAEEQSIVFETVSGYLAIMLLFDSEQDETDKAYEVCNRLIGVIQ